MTYSPGRPPRGWTAAALLSLMVLAACQPRTKPTPLGSETPRWGGTLHVANPDDFRTLDPAIGYDTTTSFGIRLLFDSLLDHDLELNLIPALADAWESSADGLVHTFHLRPNLRFHNGRPLTAHDAAYALERVLSPKVNSPGALYFRGIVGADAYFNGEVDEIRGIEVPDPLTLRITLVEPDMAFLRAMALPFAAPLPREEVERWGDQFGRHPVGAGPFKLAEWRADEKATFTRFDGYWMEGQPYLDSIEYMPGYSYEVQFLKFERGDLDQLDRITSPDYLWVQSNPELRAGLVTAPSADVYGEIMNVEMPPFDNKRFRQALNWAINRDVLSKLRNGRNTEARGPLPPTLRDGPAPPYPYGYDPAKARAMLAEAGYPDGYPDVIPYWTLQTEAAGQLAQAVQQDLQAVGVKIEIKQVDFPTYLTATGRPKKVPFCYGSWVMDFPDPSNFLVPLFHSQSASDDNATNSSFYRNPEVDRLLDAAQEEVDPQARTAYYLEAERIIVDDAPWIFEYNSLSTEMVQSWVKGYRIHPVWPRDLRGVWLDLPGTRARPPEAP